MKIGNNHGKTSAQVALRYLLQLGIPTIPKSHHSSRIQFYFDIFDFQLNVSEMNQIHSLKSSNSLFNWYGTRWI